MRKRTLTDERQSHLIELAESVADFFFPETWIDPENLFQKHSVTLSFNDYGNCFDGMLQCKNRRFHVFCNLAKVESSTSVRARFTLAHEFGHFFIDEHRNALLSGLVPAHPSFCDRPDSEIVVEKEADLFAAHLLAPSARVAKAVNFAYPSIDQVRKLQSTFKISFQSAAIRVVEGATVPCACFMWRKDGKVWGRPNRQMENMGLVNPKRKMDVLPHDCSTMQCWNEAPASSGLNEPQESVAVASNWFYGCYPGHDEIYLKEIAVRLGAYGCFTILTLHPSL